MTAAMRFDGLMGIYGTIATQQARVLGLTAGLFDPDEEYATDGLAQTIVDRPAEDAVSGGWTIEVEDGEADGTDITNEMDRLNAGPVLTDGLRWARLHGGGAILMLVRDGRLLTDPLDLGRIEQVTDLIDYPATAITAGTQTYGDASKPNYGLPTHYQLEPKVGKPFLVHETRLLLLPGDPLPKGRASSQRLPWLGRSALESCWKDLSRYREALRLARAIMERKQQAVHKMAGLGEMLAADQDRIVAKRLDLVDTVRNVFNSLAVDGEDDFVVNDSNLGGIDAVIREMKVALAGSSHMSIPILFGEPLTGLNSTGEGEQSIYHKLLRSVQERSLRPALERLVAVLWAQRSLPASEPEKWRVQWEALWSPSAKELAEADKLEADARKAQVEALDALLATSLITPEEGRAWLRRKMPDLELAEGPPPVPEMPNEPGDPGAGNPPQGGGQGRGNPPRPSSAAQNTPGQQPATPTGASA